MKKYIGIVILSALFACTNSPDKGGAEADSTAQSETDTLQVANDIQWSNPKIENIYQRYINLKNILVDGNGNAVHAVAQELSKALSAFPGCENTALIADKIAATKDIKAQRKEFTSLSSDVIALIKNIKTSKGTVYVQHCPMANNGNGGDWLSSEKQIRNPYYGDEMLDCGRIVEEIK